MRSHVERFSSPELLAERGIAEAGAKLASNPDDPEALYARAYARMGLGQYREALDDLRRAVTLKPNNAVYHASLGYALWKLGRRAEAFSAEREALRLDEKNFTANYQLGRFLLLSSSGDRKQLSEAARYLLRALELDPRRSEIRFDLLTVYRTLGDTAQAVKQLKLLEDARPSDPRITYADALLASDRGDMEAAINGFREALRLDPNLSGAQQDLGLAYIKLRRWPEAVATLAEFSRRQADSVEAAYFHALALHNAGRSLDAESETRRALRLEPGAAAVHALLGIILATRGGADQEASEALGQAVALDPRSFDAQFYMGRVQYALKDYGGAVANLRQAVALNPRHGEARFFLGTSLEAAGDSNAALGQYEKLVKLDPQSAFGKVGLGALQVKRGEVREAVETLRAATAIDPKSFEAHWALGRALMLAERYAEAVESLKTAVALIPDRPDAHYQLGLALRRLGRTDEASREFAIVERLNAEFRSRTK